MNPRDEHIRATLTTQKLTMTARMVFIKIVLSSSNDGTIGIGLNLLAEILATDKRSIRRAIAELKEAGIIVIVSGGKGRGDRSLITVKKGGWGVTLKIPIRGAGESLKGGLGSAHDSIGVKSGPTKAAAFGPADEITKPQTIMVAGRKMQRLQPPK